MADTLRSSVGDALADFGRSLGTFVGLAWLCFVAGVALARVGGVSIDEIPVPGELLVVAPIVVAFLGTSWLADGGYERLGADPAGGATFAWLAVFFVPSAFLPFRVALGYLAGDFDVLGVLDALFLLGTVSISGWLAFYGGLERLGLAPDDFVRVIVYAIVLGLGAVAAVMLSDVAWLSTDHAGGAVATAVQIAACWLGFTRDVP